MSCVPEGMSYRNGPQSEATFFLKKSRRIPPWCLPSTESVIGQAASFMIGQPLPRFCSWPITGSSPMR